MITLADFSYFYIYNCQHAKEYVYSNDDITYRGSGCNTLSHSGLANVKTQKRMFYPFNIEAPPGGGCYLFPCSSKKKWPCSFVPPKQNLDFLCSLFPKIACVPLFPLFLGLCSPDKIALVPRFPKTTGRTTI